MKEPYLLLRTRIFFAMILLVFVSFLLIGITTSFQIRENSLYYHELRLDRKEAQLQRAFKILFNEKSKQSDNQLSYLFNRRPDAFNITTSTDGGETILVVDEPSDLGTASSTLVIKTWALEPLCYYAASIGLLQKSKDSFYREASEKLLEFYERVL